MERTRLRARDDEGYAVSRWRVRPTQSLSEEVRFVNHGYCLCRVGCAGHSNTGMLLIVSGSFHGNHDGELCTLPVLS
jgi:hypothetical protein